jgi:hypothetical protein
MYVCCFFFFFFFSIDPAGLSRGGKHTNQCLEGDERAIEDAHLEPVVRYRGLHHAHERDPLVPVHRVAHKHQSLVPQLLKQLDAIESVFQRR